MNNVPVEVKHCIFKYFDKETLKILRYVCKSWDSAVIPLLFDTVLVSFSPEDIKMAQTTISQFGPHIRTLVFSTVEYLLIPRTAFEREARKNLNASGKRWGTQRKEDRLAHLRLGFQNYSKMQEDHMRSSRMNLGFAQLCYALKNCPIVRLALTDVGIDIDDRKKLGSLRGLWDQRQTCPVAHCRESDLWHLRFQLRPISGFVSSEEDTWKLAMLALWTTGVTVKELVMQPQGNTSLQVTSIKDYDRVKASLPYHVFDMEDSNPDCKSPYTLRGHFQHLTKLRLSELTIDTEHDRMCHDRCYLAKTLSAATQLQSLSIEAKIKPRIDLNPLRREIKLQSCLTGCSFPQLKHLILVGLSSTSADLLDFFNASPTIQHLTIDLHDLTHGRWDTLLESMRKYLKLKSVEMTALSGGGISLSINDLGTYRDMSGSVENFFLRDGENPFTDTNLEDYLGSPLNERIPECYYAKVRDVNSRYLYEPKWMSGGVGPVERYKLFP